MCRKTVLDRLLHELRCVWILRRAYRPFGNRLRYRAGTVSLAGKSQQTTQGRWAWFVGGRGGYLSGTLVVLQFILAVALLSGAGLMVRSFLAAENEFAGIHGERVSPLASIFRKTIMRKKLTAGSSSIS